MSDWSSKFHVESSMPARDGQYAMFVGRWQPLHKDIKSYLNKQWIKVKMF